MELMSSFIIKEANLTEAIDLIHYLIDLPMLAGLLEIYDKTFNKQQLSNFYSLFCVFIFLYIKFK